MAVLGRHNAGKTTFLECLLGKKRFEVVRDVIMQGMKAAILIVDSTKGINTFEISLIRKLKKSKIPFVVALNKQDLSQDINLDIPELQGINVVPMVAKRGIGVKETVISLINSNKNFKSL